MHMPEMRKKTHCRCAIEFWVRHGKSSESVLFKKLLNHGRHPTFIGPSMIQTSARNGGMCFAVFSGQIVAVALVNPRYSQLNVLNVMPEHRGHGIGKAFVNYLACNFARVVENKVSFFESCGYVRIGEMKHGRTLRTQTMARKNLFQLAGRMRKLLGDMPLTPSGGML